MAYWTLSQIRDEVRNYTGRFSENDLSTNELDLMINRYYQLRFPAEVKLEENLVPYTFLTIPNQPYYALPRNDYTNYVPLATIDNLPLFWYQDMSAFLAENPLQYVAFVNWTGDGSTVTFGPTAQTSIPIYPGTLTITDNVETFQDTSTTWTETNITLTGDLGGTATINLDTGSVTVTFATAPANGQAITVKYILMTIGRPTSVLLYDNQFQFFPVPNTVYNFKVNSYKVVSSLVNATDTPYLPEWGGAIATGTSKEIFRRKGENQAYAQMSQLHLEQIDYVLTRTVQTLSNTRANPNF